MAKGGFRGSYGGYGGMNQMNMMKQAQKMQQEMLRMQEQSNFTKEKAFLLHQRNLMIIQMKKNFL